MKYAIPVDNSDAWSKVGKMEYFWVTSKLKILISLSLLFTNKNETLFANYIVIC